MSYINKWVQEGVSIDINDIRIPVATPADLNKTLIVNSDGAFDYSSSAGGGSFDIIDVPTDEYTVDNNPIELTSIQDVQGATGNISVANDRVFATYVNTSSGGPSPVSVFELIFNKESNTPTITPLYTFDNWFYQNIDGRNSGTPILYFKNKYITYGKYSDGYYCIADNDSLTSWTSTKLTHPITELVCNDNIMVKFVSWKDQQIIQDTKDGESNDTNYEELYYSLDGTNWTRIYQHQSPGGIIALGPKHRLYNLGGVIYELTGSGSYRIEDDGSYIEEQTHFTSLTFLDIIKFKNKYYLMESGGLLGNGPHTIFVADSLNSNIWDEIYTTKITNSPKLLASNNIMYVIGYNSNEENFISMEFTNNGTDWDVITTTSPQFQHYLSGNCFGDSILCASPSTDNGVVVKYNEVFKCVQKLSYGGEIINDTFKEGLKENFITTNANKPNGAIPIYNKSTDTWDCEEFFTIMFPDRFSSEPLLIPANKSIKEIYDVIKNKLPFQVFIQNTSQLTLNAFYEKSNLVTIVFSSSSIYTDSDVNYLETVNIYYEGEILDEKNVSCWTLTRISQPIEDSYNKVIELTDESTDTEYPSAKCVYDNLQTKANTSDLTTHTSNSDIHVTSTDKSNWNEKYTKPSTGIPSTDIASLPYLTTAPTSDNTDGLKIVVLNSEPSTRYNGYLYIITE